MEERTAELKRMQAQLLQSEKLASLGEIVAGIAHGRSSRRSGPGTGGGSSTAPTTMKAG